MKKIKQESIRKGVSRFFLVFFLKPLLRPPPRALWHMTVLLSSDSSDWLRRPSAPQILSGNRNRIRPRIRQPYTVLEPTTRADFRVRSSVFFLLYSFLSVSLSLHPSLALSSPSQWPPLRREDLRRWASSLSLQLVTKAPSKTSPFSRRLLRIPTAQGFKEKL